MVGNLGRAFRKAVWERGFTLTELAARVRTNRERLSRIANDHSGVDARLAILLARQFGKPDDYFLQIQLRSDIRRAQTDIEAERRFKSPQSSESPKTPT